MAITKTDNGKYSVDIRPAGRYGKRFRRTFTTKNEALLFEKWALKEHGETKAWEPQQQDRRKLSDVADDWFKYHGHTLTTGKTRLARIQQTIQSLGNPPATKVDPLKFLDYRKQRMEEGVTINHVNKELTYLKSCFNKLIELQNWKEKNPFASIKPLTMNERELSFLNNQEIDRLLSALEDSRNPDALIITKICLRTGFRFGEAQNLKAEQIHHGKIHLTKTKNGKNRSVPIRKDFEQEILEGRPRKGRLFKSAWGSFRKAIEKANIDLPKGQLTHVLRHTLASHYVMNEGSLTKLNKILGHKTLEMTMKYAHLAPNHLADVMEKNPLDSRGQTMDSK